MFRKITLLLFICLGSSSVQAQDATVPKTNGDTIWRTGGVFQALFNQVSLTNWAAGGQNSISLSGIGNLFAYYKKGKVSWDNNLDLGYGLIKQDEEKIRKNDDRLEFNSKLGYDAYKGKLYYTLLFNFRSQFAPGYNYPRTDSSNYISKFLAPAFTLVALGMDYKPKDYFSVFISPLTGRFIIVNDDSLADIGAFGVEPGENVRNEFGAYLNARFQKDLVKNVNLLAKVDLFSNYKEDPQNVDVNAEILLAMKVNKVISVSLGVQLVYDDNTNILLFETRNGNKVPLIGADGAQRSGPRTQIRQIFGVGLSYNLAGYTVR
jgi:hypothetical protein